MAFLPAAWLEGMTVHYGTNGPVWETPCLLSQTENRRCRARKRPLLSVQQGPLFQRSNTLLFVAALDLFLLGLELVAGRILVADRASRTGHGTTESK